MDRQSWYRQNSDIFEQLTNENENNNGQKNGQINK